MDFLKVSWNFPVGFSDSDLFELTSLSYNKGLKVASQQRESSDITGALLDNLLTPYEKFMEENFKGLFNFDGFAFTVDNLIMDVMKELQGQHLTVDYDVCRRDLLLKTLTKFGNKNISPKYIAGNKTYKEAQNMFLENDESSEGSCFEDEMYYVKDFNGHSLTPSGTVDFASRTSLSWILSSNTDQGREPIEELVNAIFSHGMQVVKHNNTVETINYIKKINLPTTFQKDNHSKELFYDNEFLSICVKNKKRNFHPINEDLYQMFLNKEGMFATDYVKSSLNVPKAIFKKLQKMKK